MNRWSGERKNFQVEAISKRNLNKVDRWDSLESKNQHRERTWKKYSTTAVRCCTECWLDIFGKNTSHQLIKIEHLKPRGQNYPPWKWTAGSPQHHQIEIRKIESEPSTSMTTGDSSNKNLRILRFWKSISFPGWDGPVRCESMNCISNHEMFVVGTNPVLLVGSFFTRIYNRGVKVDGATTP